MIKDIKNVEIQGGFFLNLLNLKFFKMKMIGFQLFMEKMEVEKVLLPKL